MPRSTYYHKMKQLIITQENQEIKNSAVEDVGNCYSHSSNYFVENVGYNKQLSSKQDVEVIDMNMSNHKENGKLEESRSSLWLHDELDEHEPTRYLWFRDEYSESTECKEAWFDAEEELPDERFHEAADDRHDEEIERSTKKVSYYFLINPSVQKLIKCALTKV
ncbi:uncharacterized protein LOC128668679 isoform X2 [Microplitis demolitor]|uniref:uncharacterized protein LOC128668679 isoform X2 n=1 Tax=Microplitis demolitor TaxID=69319 RepID=UPI00235B5B91|nr:uncharacterized protein LOC128668679 isoform X2 [Microplitis demolitor]